MTNRESLKMMALHAFFIVGMPTTVHAEGRIKHSLVETYVARFRRGERCRSDEYIGGAINKFMPDPYAPEMLKHELGVRISAVRENIVKLLKAMGSACDRQDTNNVPVIRDHEITQALLVQGFAKDNGASAADVLITCCKPIDLAAFNDLHSPESVTEWAAAERFRTDHLADVFPVPTPHPPKERSYPRHVLEYPVGSIMPRRG